MLAVRTARPLSQERLYLLRHDLSAVPFHGGREFPVLFRQLSRKGDGIRTHFVENNPPRNRFGLARFDDLRFFAAELREAYALQRARAHRHIVRRGELRMDVRAQLQGAFGRVRIDTSGLLAAAFDVQERNFPQGLNIEVLKSSAKNSHFMLHYSHASQKV